MPDSTSTSYYCYAKVSDICQTSQKNLQNFDESVLDLATQLQWRSSVPSLNVDALGKRTQYGLVLRQCQTCEKKLNRQQQQDSHTTGTDVSSYDVYSPLYYPEETVACEKAWTKNTNWQSLKYAAQSAVELRMFSPTENSVADAPTDGSSTSKSSSSCDRSDTRLGNMYDKYTLNSRGSSHKRVSNGTLECQNERNKAQKTSSKFWEYRERHSPWHSNVCSHKSQTYLDESLRQPRKLNSDYIKCHPSLVRDSAKRHDENPRARVSNIPHTLSHEGNCHSVPVQAGKQNSEQLATPTCHCDASGYDDTARLEILKLRQRIKRYTEASDNPVLRKSHTFSAQHAQHVPCPLPKISKSRQQPIPECSRSYQDFSYPGSLLHCTKHSPSIQKNIPQMPYTAAKKKKRRTFEMCTHLLEAEQRETASRSESSDASSTESDCQTKPPHYISNRAEPYRTNGSTRRPTPFGTTTNVCNGCYNCPMTNPLSKNGGNIAEHCTKLHQRNCQIPTQVVRRNQLRRPVPGQRPLYNYDQLSYQASEVYPDLIYELEEKLSTIRSQNTSATSTCCGPKQAPKKFVRGCSGK